jgi:hypothetical protein
MKRVSFIYWKMNPSSCLVKCYGGVHHRKSIPKIPWNASFLSVAIEYMHKFEFCSCVLPCILNSMQVEQSKA